MNAFRFEVAHNNIQLTNLGLSGKKKLRFRLSGYTLSQDYLNSIKILKNTYSFPLTQAGAVQPRLARFVASEWFFYPNRSLEIASNEIYGHTGVLRKDNIENTFEIKEDKLLKSINSYSIGVTATYTNHDDNAVFRQYGFSQTFDDQGSNDGNEFLNTIQLPANLKILNGCIFEIYEIEE